VSICGISGMMIESKPSVKFKPINKSIKVDLETHEKIKFLAKTLNLKQSMFINELIDQIFNIGCTYESANISYYPSIQSSYVMCQITGKNRLISGKNRDLDDEIAKLIDTASIAKSRQTAKKSKTLVIAQ
jgi:hypothetical protein